MRLSFPNAEHADVIVDSGVVSIGSAPGNQITIAAEGVKSWHARLLVDPRGFVLEVLDAQARTHVNARPVLERALLRLGDVINIDAVPILLKPDRDDLIVCVIPEQSSSSVGPRAGVASVVLRGVSGTFFGKTVAIADRLIIGSNGSGLDLDEPGMSELHAVIEATGDLIVLRDLGSRQGTAINGVTLKNAMLHPGDQISFGRNRFVLEAPGYPMRGQLPPPQRLAPDITQTLSAIDVPDQPGDGVDSSNNGVWWLILAAGLIGLGIAGLLWSGIR